MRVYFNSTFPFVHVAFSVDSVVASFRRASEKLRALADHHDAQADTHRQAAADHDAQAETHTDESERAHAVANNIDTLIKA
jgi:predicted kinase